MRRLLGGAAPHGSVPVPGSKSYTHRALVLGALAGRRFRVVRPLDSADTRATAQGLRSLGYRVGYDGAEWTVAPGPGAPGRRRRVDCHASGTTLRFLLPVAARSGTRVSFLGEGRLRERPIAPLLDVLRAGGVSVRASPGPGAVVEVQGPVRPVDTTLDPSASSQFLSALLLTLPSLAGPSRIRLVRPEVSRPYLAATRAVLRAAGVDVVRRGGTYSIPAPQAILSRSFEIPGDASSAAYLWAAAAAAGGDVTVTNLASGWPQADLAILPWLRSMGARVARSGESVRVEGRVSVPLDADLTDAPDLLPLLAVLAALVPDRSRLRGAAHASGKESDRRAEAARLARSLGASVRESPSHLEVHGSRPTRPFRWTGPADHRLVMSAAVGAIAAPGRSVVSNAESVDKSFPTFWETLDRIGVSSEARP